MLSNIIKLIDQNISYITIIVCLLALFVMYTENKKKGCKEYLTNKPTSEKFSELIKNNRKINLKCNIDGVNYYLAQMQLTECDKKMETDCYNNITVLIPETQINSELNKYNKMINENTKICNISLQTKHPEKYPLGENINSCEIDRFYVHDFIVEEVTSKTDEIRKYLFKGTSIPNLDNSIHPTMLNQHLLNEKAINMLCSDNFAYKGSDKKSNGEVIVHETIGVDQTDLKIKLSFNTQSILAQKINGVNSYKPWPLDNPQKYVSYVGVCMDKNNMNFKCLNGPTEYKRVCLISVDEINDDNKILEFEPILV